MCVRARGRVGDWPCFLCDGRGIQCLYFGCSPGPGLFSVLFCVFAPVCYELSYRLDLVGAAALVVVNWLALYVSVVLARANWY